MTAIDESGDEAVLCCAYEGRRVGDQAAYESVGFGAMAIFMEAARGLGWWNYFGFCSRYLYRFAGVRGGVNMWCGYKCGDMQALHRSFRRA
jgi:hypothetical protein